MEKVCLDCGYEMHKMDIEVEGAKSKGAGWECQHCGNIEFDKKSGEKAVNELRTKRPVHLSLKVIKLPGGHMGIYFDDRLLKHFNLTPHQKIEAEVNKESILLRKEPSKT